MSTKKQLSQNDSDFSHHAYVCAGTTTDAVCAALEDAGFQIKGNADAYIRSYTSFGVDDARAISMRASTKSMGDSRRIFVCSTPSITNEAQNALLKLFEEPVAGTLFVLIVPSPQMLLPTLLSRVHMLHIEQVAQDGGIDVSEFLKGTAANRLEMLKVILDADERDIGAALSFLSSLELSLAPHARTQATIKEGIAAIYNARKYIADKGALMKPLLEQVALLVPRVV